MGDPKPNTNGGSSGNPEVITLITINDVERGGNGDDSAALGREGGADGREGGAIPTDVNANDNEDTQLHDKLKDEKKRYDEDYVAVWKLRQVWVANIESSPV